MDNSPLELEIFTKDGVQWIKFKGVKGKRPAEEIEIKLWERTKQLEDEVKLAEKLTQRHEEAAIKFEDKIKKLENKLDRAALKLISILKDLNKKRLNKCHYK